MRKLVLYNLLDAYLSAEKKIFFSSTPIIITYLINFLLTEPILLLSDDDEVSYIDYLDFCLAQKIDPTLLHDEKINKPQCDATRLLARFKAGEAKTNTERNFLENLPDTFKRQLYVKYLQKDGLSTLAQTASTFYRKCTNSYYWVQQSIKIGCPNDILKSAQRTQCIHHYKNLYHTLLRLTLEQRKNIKLWELLCLSGEPRAIHYAKSKALLPQQYLTEDPLTFAALSGSRSGMEYCIKVLNFNPINDHLRLNEPDRLLLNTIKSGSISCLNYLIHHLNFLMQLSSVIDKKNITISNYRNNNDWSLLHLAAGAGHEHMVKHLVLNWGMRNINATTNNGSTVFLTAALGGNVNILKFLHVMGANTHAVDNKSRNALHLAAFSGNTAAVLFCLNTLGMPPNMPAEHANVPIFYAAARGHKKTVEMLIKHQDTNIKSEDINGNNVLHFASCSRNTDLINALVTQYDFSPNHTNKVGQTPLHRAVISKAKKAIKILLKLDADPTLRDIHGNDARDYASENDELLQLIDRCLSKKSRHLTTS